MCEMKIQVIEPLSLPSCTKWPDIEKVDFDQIKIRILIALQKQVFCVLSQDPIN